jgi:transcriptional regulator with XRE-family HTH domain
VDAITPSQCRAARELLEWTQKQLAEASDLPQRTLADFETGATKPRAITLRKLRETFTKAGIAFIQIEGGGGVMRLPSQTKD